MRDGPAVDITVRDSSGGDRRVDLGDRLIGFEFEDHARKADRCIIRLDNFDLRFFDDDTWRRGQQLEVSWGYLGNMSAPQRVIVKRVSGSTILRVEGLALSVLMDQVERCRSFHGVSRSGVVRDIAILNGFSSARIFIQETDTVFETINQRAETDAHLLKRLAKKENFIFYVDAAGLHWKSEPFGDKPTHVLTYYTDQGRGDILGFDMDSDLFKSRGKVTVRGRNPRTKKQFEVSGSDRDTKRTDLGEEIEVVDARTGGITTVLKRMVHEDTRHTSAQTAEEAKKEADARFKKSSQQRIKLKLDIVGDPTLTAKRVIELRGMGDYLSGKYFVSLSKHIVGNGYAQKLMVKKGAVARVPGGGPRTQATKNRNKADERQQLIERIDERDGSSSFRR